MRSDDLGLFAYVTVHASPCYALHSGKNNWSDSRIGD